MDGSIFANIIVAAKRSINWKLNLILTPPELEVMLAEIERLRNDLGLYQGYKCGCASGTAAREKREVEG